MSQHNHVTRDIKPLGECPSCDLYWENRKKVLGKDPSDHPVNNKSERMRWEEDFSEWCSTNVTTHRKAETDEEGNVLFDIEGMKASYFAGRAKERKGE